MPLIIRKFNAQVRDPNTGNMIPAGLLSSDALSVIEEAKDDAIEAVEDKGAETLASIPNDYSTLSENVNDLKTQFSEITGSTENLFDMRSFDGVENITKDQNGFYVGTGNAIKNAVGQNTDGLPGLVFESGEQYYVQITAYSEGDSESDANGLRMRIHYTDDTETMFSFPVNTHSAATIDRVSTAEKTISKISLSYANAPSTIWHFGNILVVKSNEPVEYVQHNTAVDLIARTDIENLYAKSNVNQDASKKAYAKANQIVGGDSLIPYNELPSYYKEDPESPESYDDIAFITNRVNSVPEGKHFMLFTDTHWKSNAQKSPLLLDYLSRRLGIKNTIFGGDFIDREDGTGSVKGKYIANQVLNDFSTKVLAACGDGLLPVMGNHDNNFANSDNYHGSDLDDLYLPAVPVQKALFSNLPQNAHTYWETYGDAVLTAAHNGGITDTDANNAELEANCKLTYYYDDDDQGIRYIVIDAPRPVHGVWEDFVSIQNIVQYIPWLYDVFSSVPSGYDVVIAQHTTVTTGNLETTSQFVRTVTGMAMGLKAKANKTIRYSMEDASIPAYQVYFASYPDAVPSVAASRHKFDFRECPDVGRIIMVCGHVHSDFVAVFTPGDNEDNYYNAAEYTGGEIDQTDIVYYNNKPNGCAIPCIWTTTDAYIRTRDVSDPDRLVPMAVDTVTEQAIDIYSLTDGGVEITRVGACYAGQPGNVYGYERKISSIPMKW